MIAYDRPAWSFCPPTAWHSACRLFRLHNSGPRPRKFFNVEEVDAGIDAARATVILQQAGHAGTALLAVTADRAFLLHTPKAIGTSFFGDLSLRQQALDVVQLHKCLLEGVLKFPRKPFATSRTFPISARPAKHSLRCEAERRKSRS